MCLPSTFLGWKLNVHRNIFLFLKESTLEMILDACMLVANLVFFFLMDFELPKEEKELVSYVSAYWRLISYLVYLTHTRFDITYLVHTSPLVPHLWVVLWILRYLKLAVCQGLFFLASSTIHIVKRVNNLSDAWDKSQSFYSIMQMMQNTMFYLVIITTAFLVCKGINF